MAHTRDGDTKRITIAKPSPSTASYTNLGFVLEKHRGVEVGNLLICRRQDNVTLACVLQDTELCDHGETGTGQGRLRGRGVGERREVPCCAVRPIKSRRVRGARGEACAACQMLSITIYPVRPRFTAKGRATTDHDPPRAEALSCPTRTRTVCYV